VQREAEVKELIDTISQPGFLQSAFDFPPSAYLDAEKLVLGGHSFGGMTALSVAEKDPRVKLVFTLDPWIWVRQEDMGSGGLTLTKPSIHIITSGFSPVIQEHWKYDTLERMETFIQKSTCQNHQFIMLKGCNHYH
jgi:pimeloyl-ACP methyl ester carboxylesterase